MPIEVYQHKPFSEEHKIKLIEAHIGNYRCKNSEEYNEWCRLCRQCKQYRRKKDIKEYQKKYQPQWREKHRFKRAFYSSQRRIKKRNLKGFHTILEWKNLKKKYNYMCLCCKRFEPKIKLTEDHIIPMGSERKPIWKEWIKKHPEIYYEYNDIENIQPLCGSCNSKKNINIINYRY